MLRTKLIPRFVRPVNGVSAGRRRNQRDCRLGMACELLEERSLLSAVSPPFAETAEYDDSQILVRFSEDAIAGGVADDVLAGTELGESLIAGLYQITLGEGVSVEDALAAYSASPSVEYAQPDYEIQLNLVPNDQFYSLMWAMPKISAPQAWDVSTGSSQIVVGIIDTGVDWSHQDLAANIWSNTGETAGNGIDDDNNGFVDDTRGWDFSNNDNNPTDDNGHGTHVAGTVGAIGNNSIGVVGVNWNVTLMPLKFLSASGSGSTSDAIAAVNYARINGADVINASWGGGGFSQALNDSIQAFHNGGGIFVAAAGNDGTNNDTSAHYPSNYANVVSVAASDQNDNLASFSNYGVNNVDIAAPGVSIASTLPGNSYAYLSGTSMASPHVAGAMALVWAANPSLTNQQVIDRVLDNADAILLSSVKHGRLNVFDAIGQADTTGPKVTLAAWSGAQSGSINKIRVTFDEAINTATFSTGDAVLTGPSGSLSVQSVSVVSGSGNKQFDIAFASQTASGTYQVIVGPGIADVAGNLMNQDGDSNNGENPQDTFTSTYTLSSTQIFTWTGSSFIGGFSPTIVRLQVAPNLTIDDLNVQVRINHTWVSDLTIDVYDPSGLARRLFTRRGGSGDNVYATFDDEASTTIGSGSAPFNSSYRPEQSLSAYDGRGTAGEWQLRIADSYVWLDDGVITEFKLIVTTPTVDSDGPTITQAAWSGPQSETVNKVRVTFDETINTSTFTAGDAVLIGPNGSVSVQSVTTVSGSNNKQFDIAFATQTALGNYQVVIGPNIEDAAGNLMNQDGDGNNGENPQDQFTSTHSLQDVAGPKITQAAWSGAQAGSLNNVRVTFDEAINTSTFATGDAVLTGPSGSISVQSVTVVSGSNNKQFDVAFASQSTLGSYQVVIGPSITDTAGNLMNQDGDANNGENPQDKFTGTHSLTETNGPKITQAAWSGAQVQSVNKVRVTFDEPINTSTFSTSDAVLTGPSGSISVQSVTVVSGSSNKQFDIAFATQTALGNYQVVIGPGIADVAGNLMNQDGDANNGENPQDKFTSTYALQDVTGAKITQAAWSGAQNGSINKVRVTFDEAINTATFSTGDAVLTGPSGSLSVQSVSVVSGSGNKQFDIAFASQAASGTYQVVVGPGIADVAGNLMNQDGDSNNGENPQDTFTSTYTLSSTQIFTWTGSSFIGGFSPTIVRLQVAPNLTIDDLNVQIRINHAWVSDLTIDVYDPSGLARRLFTRRGGSGDNVYATFDDEASTAIGSGSAPFNSSYRPEQSLSAYDGRGTAGEWQLRIVDHYVWLDDGIITEFKLIVTPGNGNNGAQSIGAPGVPFGHETPQANVQSEPTVFFLVNVGSESADFEDESAQTEVLQPFVAAEQSSQPQTDADDLSEFDSPLDEETGIDLLFVEAMESQTFGELSGDQLDAELLWLVS